MGASVCQRIRRCAAKALAASRYGFHFGHSSPPFPQLRFHDRNAMLRAFVQLQSAPHVGQNDALRLPGHPRLNLALPNHDNEKTRNAPMAEASTATNPAREAFYAKRLRPRIVSPLWTTTLVQPRAGQAVHEGAKPHLWDFDNGAQAAAAGSGWTHYREGSEPPRAVAGKSRPSPAARRAFLNRSMPACR